MANTKNNEFPRYVSAKEFKAMFPPQAAMKHQRDYVLFLTMLAFGLRNAEARTLKLKQFKERGGDIFLEVKGKGAKDRTVLVDPETWGTITTYAKGAGIKRNDWLFPNKRGGPIGNRAVQLLCKKHLKGKVEDWETVHPHSFRHGFGVALAEQGISGNVIQLLMGHASITTTQIYTKMRPMDAAKAMRGFKPLRYE